MDRASSLLDEDRIRPAIVLLKKIHAGSLPASARAEYFDRRASIASQTGRHAEALNFVRRAGSLYQQLDDRAGLRACCQKEGDLLRQKEQPLKARAAYQKALRMASGLDLADALMGLALCDRSQGVFVSSRRQMDRVAVLYRKTNDQLGLAYALWAQATTDRFLGRFRTAEKEARTSLSLYRRLRDRGGEAYAWAALGGVSRMQGRALESGCAYQKARSIFLSQKDEFGLAYASCGIGNSFRMRGHAIAALKWSGKAEVLYRRLRMEGPLAYVLWSQAQSNLIMGRRAVARRKLSECTRLFKKVCDLRGLVYADLGWGEYHRAQSVRLSHNFYRRAGRRAHRSGLMFEWAVSQHRLQSSRRSEASLRKTGVQWSRFLTYKSLP